MHEKCHWCMFPHHPFFILHTNLLIQVSTHYCKQYLWGWTQNWFNALSCYNFPLRFKYESYSVGAVNARACSWSRGDSYIKSSASYWSKSQAWEHQNSGPISFDPVTFDIWDLKALQRPGRDRLVLLEYHYRLPVKGKNTELALAIHNAPALVPSSKPLSSKYHCTAALPPLQLPMANYPPNTRSTLGRHSVAGTVYMPSSQYYYPTSSYYCTTGLYRTQY